MTRTAILPGNQQATPRLAHVVSACLCAPCTALASTSVDICGEPAQQNHLTVAYHDEQRSAFEGSRGETNRTDYSTDFLFVSNDTWRLAAGHRSTILNVDDLALQTNGYLHTFFFPVHRTRHSGPKSFRLSFAPVLSASSNVAKDPAEYSRDSFQLLAALVWTTQLSRRLELSYGVCGDHRLGGYQVYPLIRFSWQAGPDWTVDLGFPTSQLSYRLSKSMTALLRIAPNGNEWHVRDKSLQNQSQVIYEAYMLEWALSWRAHKHVALTASISRDFQNRYEMTLSNNDRVRFSSDPATRFGVELAWFF